MNDGIIILSIILSLFFIGSFCMLMSLFEKEEINYYQKPNTNYHNYDDEDLIVSDENLSVENNSDDYGIYNDDDLFAK